MAGALTYAALVIFYSLLAAALIEALLYAWRVKNAFLAVRLRLLTLAVPPLVPPLFHLLSSFEGLGGLRQGLALLDLRNWFGPDPSLLHPAWILVLIAVTATTLLMLGLEATDIARQMAASRAPIQPLSDLPGRLRRAVERLEGRGLHTCPVLAVPQSDAVAYAVGVRQPKIVVSTALLRLLDEEELEAVLAHEMAHVKRRDNWFGWLLFSLRLASFYNPVALFVFHQISHEVERMCDADASAATGKPLPLASALIKVFRASRQPARGGRLWSRRLASRTATLEKRARRALVTDRVERLVHPEKVDPVSLPRLRLGLALAAILGMGFMVVY